MKRINISYVFYFNKKYQRVGHLFQDRYESEKIENDSYLLSVIRYIHKNPVRAGLVRKVEDYQWSSYQAYIDVKHLWKEIVETEFILGIFTGNEQYTIDEFISFMQEDDNGKNLDIEEDAELLARKLWCKLQITAADKSERLRIFQEKTHLSLRKMEEITEIQKDVIAKILKLWKPATSESVANYGDLDKVVKESLKCIKVEWFFIKHQRLASNKWFASLI